MYKKFLTNWYDCHIYKNIHHPFLSLNSVLLLFCRETCDSCKGNSTTGNVNKKNVQSVVKTKEHKVDDPKQVENKGDNHDSKPEPNPKENIDEEKVQELLNVLEDEYKITGYMDEEAVKEKIRELNYDKDALFDWFENSYLNGDN